MRDRLRLAIPNKGRLVEPPPVLGLDAGRVSEELASAAGLEAHRHAAEVRFAPRGSADPLAGSAVGKGSR